MEVAAPFAAIICSKEISPDIQPILCPMWIVWTMYLHQRSSGCRFYTALRYFDLDFA